MPTLNWIGKDAVVTHHQKVPYRLLEPVPELHGGDEQSGNLIVQGDNLHALKALLPRYAGKVKCIYIDPPYNTGKEEWVYNDNVNSPEIRLWLNEVVGKEGEDLSRHDKWLCMMYPRLRLLKELLSEDGVIYCSIDENEVASLRYVMDEIFGSKNLVADFVWNSEGHSDNQFHIKVEHEYIVFYAKNRKRLVLGDVVDPNTREESNLWKGFAENSITKNGPRNPPSEVFLPAGFPADIEDGCIPPTEYTEELILDMESGRFTSSQLKDKYGVSFPIRKDRMVVKDGKLVEGCVVYSGWANARKLHTFIVGGCKGIEETDGVLSFYLKGKGVIYYKKVRKKASNIVSVLRNMGTTEQMRSELHRMGISFQYPKPKELLQYLIKVSGVKDGYVLDSFAGSGTTAHAVVKQNAEDGGDRKFILVEMGEYIAESVTSERVRRVIEGYVDNKGASISGLGGGFSYYRLSDEPMFDAFGQVRDDVTFEQLAEFVWFKETGTGLPPGGAGEKRFTSPLLGIHEGQAIYLLFNGILGDKSVNGGNVLSGPILDSLPTHDGPKTLYAAACRLGASRLRREQIVFKQTPYALDQ